MKDHSTKQSVLNFNRVEVQRMRDTVAGVKPLASISPQISHTEWLSKCALQDAVEEVRARNLEYLIATIREYNLQISPREIMKWRALAPHRGQITGFDDSLGRCTILTTDGVVAWFALPGSKRLFFGHLANFKGRVTAPYCLNDGKVTKFGTPKKKRPAKLPSEEQARANRMRELLLSED